MVNPLDRQDPAGQNLGGKNERHHRVTAVIDSVLPVTQKKRVTQIIYLIHFDSALKALYDWDPGISAGLILHVADLKVNLEQEKTSDVQLHVGKHSMLRLCF